MPAPVLRYLAAEIPDLEEVRQYLGYIARDGKRAAEVISRIRALVNRVPERRERLDLNESIFEVIALTQTELRRNPVDLQTNLASGLPQIPADRVQLQQVVLNLIVNALEAMNEAGERPRTLVVNSGTSTSNEVFVEVRDSGPGWMKQTSSACSVPFIRRRLRAWYGSLDQPFDRRGARRTVMGHGKQASRRCLPVHLADPGRCCR